MSSDPNDDEKKGYQTCGRACGPGVLSSVCCGPDFGDQFLLCPERISTMVWLIENKPEWEEKAIKDDYSFLEPMGLSETDTQAIVEGFQVST
jgi:hypothetical protein